MITPGFSTRVMAAAVIFALLFFPASHTLRGDNKNYLEEEWQRMRSAERLFSQGLREFNEGRPDSAEAVLLKCLSEMPRHANAHYYLANLNYIRGDYRQALVHIDQSLAHLPFLHELQDYGIKMKNWKIDDTLQRLTSEWENTTSCRFLRKIESVSNDFSVKKSSLESLAENQKSVRSRQMAHYLYFCGNILFQLQRFGEARDKYLEAIGLNPRHASAYNNAAAICYLSGDPSAALSLQESAENQGLEDNLNLKLIFLVNESLGRPTEGILEEDLSPGPENELGVMRFALAFQSRDAMLAPLYENCYVVYSRKTRQAVIIDPGVQDLRIDSFIEERGLEIKAILNTHGHQDHTGANGYYSGLFGAPVRIHEKDAGKLAVPPGGFLEDGEILSFDGLTIMVFHTPGHTKGSLCFLIGDFLFTGDTLFWNDIGKVSGDDAATVKKIQRALVQDIKNKLMTLPGGTRVCPGHGRTSTIAGEITDNPFLRHGQN